MDEEKRRGIQEASPFGPRRADGSAGLPNPKGGEGEDEPLDLSELDAEELAALLEEAARAGDVELIEKIAELLGGLELLAELFPELLEMLAEAGNEAAAIRLAARGLLRRPSRSRDLPRASSLAWSILQAAAAAGEAALLAQIFAREAWLADLSREAAASGAGSLAALAPNPETVSALLAAEIPVDAPSPSGVRPLEALLDDCSSFEPGSPEAEILFLFGAARDWGRLGASADALEKAAGKPEALEALLAAGADPNCSCRDGSSPLAKAAEAGCERSCEILLKHGADPNRPDRFGRLPEERASKPECKSLIRNARAEMEVRLAQRKLAELGVDLGAARGAGKG